MGMSATGKGVDVQLIDIIRFGGDGLAREHWGTDAKLLMLVDRESGGMLE